MPGTTILKPFLRFKDSRFSRHNYVELLESGEAYFDRLFRMVDEAQHLFHLQTYIFEYDETGQILVEKLINAAKRGVNVFVLLDAYGSNAFRRHAKKLLREHGINIRFFSPLFSSGRMHFGVRLHHKIAVADIAKMLITGINVSNAYSGFHGEVPWFDYAIYAEGKVAMQAERICENTWNRSRKKNVQFKRFQVPVFENTVRSPRVSRMRLNQNDWLGGWFNLSYSYRQAVRKSRKELLIVASYFMPSTRMRVLLKLAARRGVRIRIILSGKSDVGVMKRAGSFFYKDLLKEGVELYEWMPSILHAKIALYDEKWLTIGSYNLNSLSDYGSIECNAEIIDPEFVQGVSNNFNALIESHCQVVDPEFLKSSHTWISRLLNWTSYYFVRFSFYVLFFLQKQDR